MLHLLVPGDYSLFVIRSDAFMLASRFGSLADVLRGSQEDFSACPGLGPIKARSSAHPGMESEAVDGDDVGTDDFDDEVEQALDSTGDDEGSEQQQQGHSASGGGLVPLGPHQYASVSVFEEDFLDDDLAVIDIDDDEF
eukprot:gene12245-12382_t